MRFIASGGVIVFTRGILILEKRKNMCQSVSSG